MRTLNADLGEHEPPARTRALMRLVDLANVACGGHAGTVESMRRVIRLGKKFGVRLGAHPGLERGFGREAVGLAPRELGELLVRQAGAFEELCAAQGAAMHHVKLHGALYHAVEASPELASAYVETIGRRFPRSAIIAFAGGLVIGLARERGVAALAEAFAERGYRADGTLVPRGEPGDLIADPREVARRIPALRGDTICIHADSPNAVSIARAARRALG